MTRTRGGLVGNHGRGYGRGRGRGRGRNVQPDRVRLVELVNILTRSRTSQRESSSSSASIGNECDDFHDVQTGSLQGSSTLAEPSSIFEKHTSKSTKCLLSTTTKDA